MTEATKQKTAMPASIPAPAAPALPTVEHVFLELGLYEAVPLSGNSAFPFRIAGALHHFDAHCIHCGRSSTFRSDSVSLGLPPAAFLTNRRFARVFECTRDLSHEYYYVFEVRDQALIKIGQQPSLADIGAADIKRFKSILGKGLFGDLSRAVGLFSHGIGAGSLVYLRRIFERIIEDERKAAEAEGEQLVEFDKKRLSEKIDALAHRLPRSLSTHRKAYGLLSAGIHELTEEQCRSLFPVLKAVIILILEEHLRDAERKKSEAALLAALQTAEASLE